MRLITALLITVGLTTAGSIVVAQKSSAAPPVPGFEYLGSLQVQTGTRTVVENGPQGTRTIVQILGGRVEGPRLKATVDVTVSKASVESSWGTRPISARAAR